MPDLQTPCAMAAGADFMGRTLQIHFGMSGIEKASIISPVAFAHKTRVPANTFSTPFAEQACLKSHWRVAVGAMRGCHFDLLSPVEYG